jgi:hypothetical protein
VPAPARKVVRLECEKTFSRYVFREVLGVVVLCEDGGGGGGETVFECLMDCCRLLVWGMKKRELTKSSMKDRDPGLQVPQQSSESTFYGPKYVVMVDKLVEVVVRLISLAVGQRIVHIHDQVVWTMEFITRQIIGEVIARLGVVCIFTRRCRLVAVGCRVELNASSELR